MTELHSLGLEDRDRVNSAFGGGIPAGTLGLIEGPQGAGKSALAQRFVYGFCETGVATTYVTPELTAGEFIAQMQSLSYGVVEHLLGDRLLFLSAEAATYGEDRPLIAPFVQADTLWRADAVVVDGLGTLVRNDPELAALVESGDADRVTRRLVSAIQGRADRETTVLLTVADDALPEKALRPLRSAAGFYLDLAVSEVAGDVRRSAVVRRFEEMPAPVNDTVSYSVEQGRGITIVTRTVA
jgi:flagellar protein FlaH